MPRIHPRPSRTTTPRAALLVAFVALSTDMLIYGIAVPVLPKFPAVATGGDTATGILFAVYAAALVGVTPLAGRWVDRRGPRTPLLVGMIGLATATVVFALVEPFPALLFARAAQGAAAACSWVAGLALVAAVTPFQQRARNLGLVLSAVGIGVLIGPPLGGWLADLFGRHVPFLVGAAFAVLDGLLRIALVGPVTTADDDPGTIKGVWRVPGAASVCAVVAIGAGLLAITEPVLPRHLHDLGYTATQAGLVYGSAVLASAMVTPVVGSLTHRLPTAALVAIGSSVGAAGMAGVGLAHSLVALTAAMAMLGIGAGAVLGAITPAMSTLGSQAGPPALGAAFALFNLAYACGLLLGPALSGPSTSLAGFGPATVGLAAICALAALGSCWRMRSASALHGVGGKAEE